MLRWTPGSVLALLSLGAAAARADLPPRGFPFDLQNPIQSLKTMAVPRPPNLSQFVRDKKAALVLGKALFWDMQVGSDGQVACASCHFHAGGDSRSRNQVNPGLNGGNGVFDRALPNDALVASDFPFHRFADPSLNISAVLDDTDDVTGSAGVVRVRFNDVIPGETVDDGDGLADPLFHRYDMNLRQTTGRNTPTVINAVFNFRNFWDGRAQNDFNGVNPFGARDSNARVFHVTRAGAVERIAISLPFSSLASQAVGPPLSDVEMSFVGRTFPKIGKKLLALQPLAQQLVDPADSVLAPYVNDAVDPAPGLSIAYRDLIARAFSPEWWDAVGCVSVDSHGVPTFTPPRRRRGVLQPGVRDEEGCRSGRTDRYSLMEYNFSLFFGLALQQYEATLVADDTPLDRFFDGDAGALTPQQQLGLSLFNSKGHCVRCHGGALLSNASTQIVEHRKTERMFMGGISEALYDDGFYNIGVRPTDEDAGIGGNDPFGRPLGLARQVSLGAWVDPDLSPTAAPGIRVANDGAFKVPGLRNVELTAPYFHNGGQATLEQVVEFYNRGGDFRAHNAANVDPDIRSLRLTSDERAALVSFLRALTDERVRRQQAPFDHPQLLVVHGYDASDPSQDPSEILLEVPAVGRHGGALGPGFLQ